MLESEIRPVTESGADKLAQLTPKTIEYHKSRIMLQLNVNTSAQLIRYAVEHGISSV